jgi:glycerol kinase
MKQIDSLVKLERAGCGGLLYLPYLNGERCPFEDGNARACFIGISASTTREQMLRAVMEGVAFALRSSCDALAGGELHDSGMCNVLLIPTTVISIDGNWYGNNKGVCQIIQSQKHKAITHDVV